MADEDASLDEIAVAVGRTEAAVWRVLNPKPKRKSKKVKREAVVHSRKRDNVLEHRYWLRPDLAVSLSLPVDLRADEAGRLAELVRNLPFSEN